MNRELRKLVSLLTVEQRVFWRNRSTVFFGFAMPLVLLVLLASTGSHDFRKSLVPAIASITVASNTFQSLAIALAFHRDQGVLKRLVATPVPLRMIVTAKVLSTALVAVIEVVLVVLVGRLWLHLGFPRHPLQFSLLVLFGAAAFSALGFAVASIIRSGDSAPAVTNAVYLPLIFLSFDTGLLHYRVLEWIAKSLPLYHLVAPLKATWFDAHVDVLPHLAVLTAWCAAAAVFSSRRFRWQPADHAT